jgi:hypothetical protein
MSNQIKERPILFSAPMVRAIQEGRKTVTRRPVKVQPFDLSWSRRDHRFEYTAGRAENGDEIDGFYAYSTRSGGEWSAKFPYGQPGDRLWVREAWTADAQVDAVAPRDLSQGEPIRYPSDGAIRQTGCSMITPGRTRPSIHMPRWVSRILLEITAVRVERLREGEGETANESRYVAEGIHRIHHGDGAYYFHPFNSDPGPGNWCDPFDAWRELWVSINGADSWNSNPWVWVVEFKQVTP